MAPPLTWHVRCGCPDEAPIVDASYASHLEAFQHAEIAATIENCPCWIKDPEGNIWPVEPAERDLRDVWRIASPLIGGGLGLYATIRAFQKKPSVTAQILLGVWAIWTAASGATQGLHAVTQKRYGDGS